jgi:hypothetical protein
MGLGICVSSDYVLPTRLFSKDDGSFVSLELRLWAVNGNIISQDISTNEYLAFPPEQVKSVEVQIGGCFFTDKSIYEPISKQETSNGYDVVEKKILPVGPFAHILKMLKNTYKNDTSLANCTGQVTPSIDINGLSCPCKVCNTEDPYVTLYAKVHRGKGTIRLYDNMLPETLSSKD